MARPRSLPFLGAFLLAGTLLAGAAQAQGACDLVTSVNPASQQHALGETLRYDVTVEARGALGGEVRLRIGLVSPGWDATVAPETITLAGGESRTGQVLVTAPAQPQSGPAGVTVEGTLSCVTPLGLPAGRDVDPQVLTPTTLPPAAGPATGVQEGPAILFLLAIVAIGGLGAVIVTRRPRGLRLHATSTHLEVAPGGAASVALQLTNTSREPARVALQAEGAPARWRVGLPSKEVAVKAEGSAEARVVVRAPAGAAHGTVAKIRVVARAAGAPAPVVLRLEARVASGGGGHPEVMVRDEASLEDEGRA